MQAFDFYMDIARGIESENVKKGFIKARARGRKGGRPAKLSQKDRRRIRSLYTEDNSLTVSEIGAMFGVTRQTVYRVVNEVRQGDGEGEVAVLTALGESSD